MSERGILSKVVDVRALPVAGRLEVIVASEAERTALAEAYDLPEVKSLSAELTAAPGPRGAVLVEGRVRAEIVQECVVTLVPVDQVIDEPVEMRFVPPGSPEAEAAAMPHHEGNEDAGIGDPPEILAGSTIDLGAIAEEYFVLAIDPYPRAPGAELPADFVASADKRESPFAALARLRDGAPKKG